MRPPRGYGDGVGESCETGNLSNTFMLEAYPQTCGCPAGTWTVSMFDNADADGPWTAAIYSWY